MLKYKSHCTLNATSTRVQVKNILNETHISVNVCVNIHAYI